MTGDRAPFLAGAAGIAVACTSTLGNISYIGAVVHAPAANVVFLIALTPVIAASLSHLILGEKVHAYTWSATILALCGAALLHASGDRDGCAGQPSAAGRHLRHYRALASGPRTGRGAVTPRSG
mgnify:CR=1 FL=1